MKVTHINTFCTGGAAKACRRVTEAVGKEGIDSKMLVLYKTNDDPGIVDVRDELSFLKNYQMKFRNKWFVMDHERKFGNKEELFSSYEPVWDVAAHSSVKNSDVVNLHWVSGFLNFPSFFNSVKKKMVFTMHDYFPFSGGFHYPNPLFEKTSFSQTSEEKRKMLFDLYSKSNIHFVGTSEYMIGEFKKQWGDQFKISLVRNPVDSTIFNSKNRNDLRKKYGYGESDKVLLFMNEIAVYKRKGFQYFNQMLPDLIKMGYKIILAGEKNDSVKHGSVFQAGFLRSDKELSEFYAIADLLLCASMDDNSPNIIAEANCCGTPVIAFAAGGIPEMIEAGKNGFLINKFDTDAYLKKLNDFKNTELNREVISNKAHEMYSGSLAAKKYKDIYLNG